MSSSGIGGGACRAALVAESKSLSRYEIEGGEGVAMYQFSRAIYRELAPYIATPKPGSTAMRPRDRRRRESTATSRSCTRARSTIERMATDRHYFAHPARTLFCDIRMYFPMNAQAYVHQVVFRYIGLAQRYPQGEPAGGARGDQRRAAAVPRDDAQGRGVPAHAAGAQRLLPFAPASRGHRGPRAAGGLTYAPGHAPGSRRRRDLHRRGAGRRGTGAVTRRRSRPRPPTSRAGCSRRSTRCSRAPGARHRAGRALRARHDGRDERAAGGSRGAHGAGRDGGLHRRRRARSPGAPAPLPAVRGVAGAARAAGAALRRRRSG